MPPRFHGPQFIDLTTESGGKRHLNGHARPPPNEIHIAPEQRALDVLEHGDPAAEIAAAEHQRMWGAPPPPQQPPSPPKQLTARQQRWMRMLLDPNIAPKKHSLVRSPLGLNDSEFKFYPFSIWEKGKRAPSARYLIVLLASLTDQVPH
jgi:hypothetical protein